VLGSNVAAAFNWSRSDFPDFFSSHVEFRAYSGLSACHSKGLF
jgi:hypothetical protein